MRPSHTLALRDVARTPLMQAMAVLWVIGVVQLGARLPDGVLEVRWPVGAALAAVAALAMLGSQRLLRFAAVPALLGLIAALTFARALGVDTAVGAGTLAAAYALGVWYSVCAALAHPASERVARWLRMAGGHPGMGGRAEIESAVHWSGFATCLAVLAAVPLMEVARSAGGVPASPPWPLLALAGAFFFAAAWRYGHRSHCYAFLVSVLFGVWLACARLTAPAAALETVLGAPDIALWTVLLSLVLTSVADVLDRRADGPFGARARILYGEPLRAFALGLALLVLAHQIVFQAVLVLLVAGPPGDGSGAGLALLAGIATLHASRARARPGWIFLGVLVVWLSLYGIAIDALVPEWRALRHRDAAHHAFVLAALALAAVSLARFLQHRPALAERYAVPVHRNAAIAFTAAFLAAAVALAGPAPGGALLALAMALLVACVMPLLGPLENPARWRGLVVPVLLTGFVSSVFAVPDLDLAGAARGAQAWGLALWLGGNFGVGRWNRRLPGWSIDETSWPWFGLGFVFAGAAVFAVFPGALWIALASVSVYLFALIRNSDRAFFPWLAAGTLSAAGLALSGWWTAALGTRAWPAIADGTMFASILWLNLLFAGARAWRRHGARVAGWLGWRRFDIDEPLTVFAGAALVSTLAVLVVHEIGWALGVPMPFGLGATAGLAAPGLTGTGFTVPGLPLLGLALVASFAHALQVRPDATFAHAFLAASLALLVALLMASGDARHVPLVVAFAGIGLLALWRSRARARAGGAAVAAVDSATRTWLAALPLAALGLAVYFPLISLADRLVVIAVLVVHGAALGWWQQKRRWLLGAGLLAFVLEHAVWLLWWAPGELHRALPWSALAGAANALLIIWADNRLERAFARGGAGGAGPQRGALRALRSALATLLPLAISVTLLELAVQLVWVAVLVDSGVAASRLGAADPYVTLASWAALVAMAIRTARRRRQGRWIYAAALLGGVAALYLRVVIIGLGPPGVIDTAVLIGAAYALFAVQRLTRSVPTLHVCLALPLFAVATLPAQVGSVHAGAALMAIAVLYLLIRGRTGNPVPLYLGVLALNASVYLWVPLWIDRFGVFQLYVMPAAVSVLALLHVHRRELRPSVLNGARLAALATLYCGAALDVFVHPSLAMFGLALALSIISILLGIALRIRAFLYAGIAFLVLNVGFQLLQLYPEQRLGRAILLIALGVTITGGMIGFNIKREEILRRVRIARADLASWE